MVCPLRLAWIRKPIAERLPGPDTMDRRPEQYGVQHSRLFVLGELPFRPDCRTGGQNRSVGRHSPSTDQGLLPSDTHAIASRLMGKANSDELVHLNCTAYLHYVEISRCSNAAQADLYRCPCR